HRHRRADDDQLAARARAHACRDAARAARPARAHRSVLAAAPRAMTDLDREAAAALGIPGDAVARAAARRREGRTLGEALAELGEPPDLLEAGDDTPVIRLVNALLAQAVKDGASDIHIEPWERGLAVRFRTDGLLHDVLAPPARLAATIASRVKIMAGLDIAERRLPQDGRIRVRVAGRDID